MSTRYKGTRSISPYQWGVRLHLMRRGETHLVRSVLDMTLKVKLANIVEGDLKALFSIATTPSCRGGRCSFLGLLHFTLDPYLIMLSVKQGGIKYHFLSLWYDSTWD